jgi:quinol monooxygenase YgiN
MRPFFPALMASVLMSAFALPPLQAQDGALYVVSYIEVAPEAAADAAGLLRQFADTVRKEPANMRFELLQRVALPNQFATVAVWKDRSAYEPYALAPGSNAYADRLKPYLISGIDERLHNGIETAGAPAKVPAEAVYVVTHVDVPPPSKDQCVSLLKTLVEDSRREAGVARFEVFQQTSRPNHFSVVEVWNDRNAYTGHITAAHTKKFREQLTPMSGALYDERLYKAP